MKKFKSKVSDMVFGQKSSRNNNFDAGVNRLRNQKGKIPQVPQTARNSDVSRLSQTMSAFNFKNLNNSTLAVDG